MIKCGSLTDTNVEDVYEELLMDCEHKKSRTSKVTYYYICLIFKYLCMAKCLH